jgi:hypothetical protein
MNRQMIHLNKGGGTPGLCCTASVRPTYGKDHPYKREDPTALSAFQMTFYFDLNGSEPIPPHGVSGECAAFATSA